MSGGSSLPCCPRALKEEWAAAYCGLCRTTFSVEVAPAVKAVRLTPGRVAWLRDDLDESLDGKRAGGHVADLEVIDDEIRTLGDKLAAPKGRARRLAPPG